MEGKIIRNSIENGEDQGCGCGYFLREFRLGSKEPKRLPNINRLKLTKNRGEGADYDLLNAKAKPT